MKKKHRPIVINGNEWLDPEEEKKILEIAKNISETLKLYHAKLDSLTAQYRDIVGFANPTSYDEHVSFRELCTPDIPKEWVDDAVRTRKQWVMEELSGTSE